LWQYHYIDSENIPIIHFTLLKHAGLFGGPPQYRFYTGERKGCPNLGALPNRPPNPPQSRKDIDGPLSFALLDLNRNFNRSLLSDLAR
jgi:hypothetical protein